jgi:transposase
MQKTLQKQHTLFVGIDPHKQTHTFAAVTPFGDRVGHCTFENSVIGFEHAMTKIQGIAHEHNLTPVIGIEDAAGNGEFCARYFYGNGFTVKTVNPIIVEKQSQYNTHPEKSDSQDAEEVARAILVKSGRLPDYIVSEERDLAKDVNLLVKDREELKNKLHAALQRTWGSLYKTVYQKTIFGTRALDFWIRYPTARDFKTARSHKYEKPEALKKSSTDDLPPVSDIDRQHIRRAVKRLQNIKEELRQIEQPLKSIVEKHFDYLTSLPGCGFRTAAKIYAEVNDVARFANEGKLARYSGIAPRKNESGSRKKDVQSKRGNVRLRQAIKTIALSQIGRRGCQIGKAYFRKKVKEGKTKRQALRCLMRQLTKIIFQMLAQQRPYY